jgi:hypothetical protein
MIEEPDWESGMASSTTPVGARSAGGAVSEPINRFFQNPMQALPSYLKEYHLILDYRAIWGKTYGCSPRTEAWIQIERVFR